MVFGLTDEVKVKVNSEKDCVQTVSVELPAAKVKEEIEAAFLKVQSQAKIPGFRPGKSPIELVKKNFKESAYAQAQDSLLQVGVSEAFKAKKIHAVQSPVIQSMQFDPEKSFQFEFKVEVAPQVKLGGYKGLKLNKTVKTISDADVEKALKNIADMNAHLVESKSEVLEKTHFAVIDYEGFIGDKPIEGAKAENFLMDLSAPQAIAGLSDGLVGSKVNEERSISVKFPEDSPAKELAGKEASFKVKLKVIKEKKVPSLDDEFAKDLGLASLEDMKSKIKANLENEQTNSSRRDIEKQISDKLVEEHEFAVPPTMLEDQVKHSVEGQKDKMLKQGIPLAEQVKFFEGKMPEIRKAAEMDLRLAYVLNAIAEAEKITVTEEDVQSRIDEILSKTEANQKEMVANALKGGYNERLRSELRETKIYDFIISQAKVKEINGGA